MIGSWFIKDFADGWIQYYDVELATKEAMRTGAIMVYSIDSTPPKDPMQENRTLRARVTELLEANSILVLKNRDLQNEKKFKPTHFHVKREKQYQHMCTGKLQTDKPIDDYTTLAGYRDEEGAWWYRPVNEFEDQERFKRYD